MLFRSVTDAQALSEVVVVGYGTMRKADLTGAVTQVDNKAFEKSVTTSIDQVLQGRAAGVQIQANTGTPGGSSTIRIRGTNSLNATSQPIFYDNHFPTSEKNQRKSYGAAQKSSEDDSPFHGSQSYPAFSAGTFRSQPGFVVIAMFKVEIIIHQIAVYLHHPCKEQAE